MPLPYFFKNSTSFPFFLPSCSLVAISLIPTFLTDLFHPTKCQPCPTKQDHLSLLSLSYPSSLFPRHVSHLSSTFKPRYDSRWFPLFLTRPAFYLIFSAFLVQRRQRRRYQPVRRRSLTVRTERRRKNTKEDVGTSIIELRIKRKREG